MAKVGTPRKPVEEWVDKFVEIPFKEKDYIEKSNDLNNLNSDLEMAQIKSKLAKEAVKDIQGEINAVVSQIVKKRKEIELPTLWIFNWDENTKRLMARLESNEIICVLESEITDLDRQLQIPGGSENADSNKE